MTTKTDKELHNYLTLQKQIMELFQSIKEIHLENANNQDLKNIVEIHIKDLRKTIKKQFSALSPTYQTSITHDIHNFLANDGRENLVTEVALQLTKGTNIQLDTSIVFQQITTTKASLVLLQSTLIDELNTINSSITDDWLNTLNAAISMGALKDKIEFIEGFLIFLSKLQLHEPKVYNELKNHILLILHHVNEVDSSSVKSRFARVF